jgi:hypothetical protein
VAERGDSTAIGESELEGVFGPRAKEDGERADARDHSGS